MYDQRGLMALLNQSIRAARLLCNNARQIRYYILQYQVCISLVYQVISSKDMRKQAPVRLTVPDRPVATRQPIDDQLYIGGQCAYSRLLPRQQGVPFDLAVVPTSFFFC